MPTTAPPTGIRDVDNVAALAATFGHDDDFEHASEAIFVVLVDVAQAYLASLAHRDLHASPARFPGPRELIGAATQGLHENLEARLGLT